MLFLLPPVRYRYAPQVLAAWSLLLLFILYNIYFIFFIKKRLFPPVYLFWCSLPSCPNPSVRFYERKVIFFSKAVFSLSLSITPPKALYF